MSYYYENNNRGGFLSNIPVATRNLIIINVLIWIMSALDKSGWMLSKFALFYPGSPFFHIWQPITHMFMHGGFWHVFFNMYTLFIFGSVLERMWGPKKYLVFYFVTGLGAAALHMGVQWIESLVYMGQIAQGSADAQTALHILNYTPTVGASGAIYGLLLGYAMLFPDSRLTLIFPPITLTAKWFVIIFAGIELVTGVMSVSSVNFGTGIAHFAHLGGMLFGWLLISYWKKKNEMYRYHD